MIRNFSQIPSHNGESSIYLYKCKLPSNIFWMWIVRWLFFLSSLPVRTFLTRGPKGNLMDRNEEGCAFHQCSFGSPFWRLWRVALPILIPQSWQRLRTEELARRRGCIRSASVVHRSCRLDVTQDMFCLCNNAFFFLIGVNGSYSLRHTERDNTKEEIKPIVSIFGKASWYHYSLMVEPIFCMQEVSIQSWYLQWKNLS